MEKNEGKLCFPLFLDLSAKRVTVVGGGRIAARRVLSLLDFAGEIVVVAPEVRPELEALALEGRITLRRDVFRPSDLEGADLVLTATGTEAVDSLVSQLCRERRIPVNVASHREKCDFYFPGLARRGNVVAGVTAGGGDHRLAKRITEAIRQLLADMDENEL